MREGSTGVINGLLAAPAAAAAAFIAIHKQPHWERDTTGRQALVMLTAALLLSSVVCCYANCIQLFRVRSNRK